MPIVMRLGRLLAVGRLIAAGAALSAGGRLGAAGELAGAQASAIASSASDPARRRVGEIGRSRRGCAGVSSRRHGVTVAQADGCGNRFSCRFNKKTIKL